MAKKTLTTRKPKGSAAPEAAKQAPQPVAVVAKDATALTAAPKPNVVRTGMKQPSPMQLKRIEHRNAVFGEDSWQKIWHKREHAFCTMPRAMSLLCTLIRNLRSGADAERVYLDLWSRQHEEGFVEVYDEEEFAMSCDYPEKSGVRYWRKGMAELVRLGFIEVKPKHNKKYGYVLILHPDDVVRKIYGAPKTTAPPWWLELYEQLLRRQGAKKREAPSAS